MTFSYEEIDTQIRKFFKNLEVDEKEFKKYKKLMAKRFGKESKENSTDLRNLQLQYNKLRAERDTYIEKMMSKDLDDVEKKIYDKKKSEFNDNLDMIKDDMQVNENEMRDIEFEFELLCRVTRELPTFYKSADYVRR